MRGGAQPLVWGCACGRTKGLSARPLETFGCLCGAFYVRGGAQPLGVQGSALRGGQGLSARPCNLRVSPSMAAGRVRGVALDVQESRPALRRRPTSLYACERPLAPPALLYSGDRGEFATFVVSLFICGGNHNGNGCFAVLWEWLRWCYDVITVVALFIRTGESFILCTLPRKGTACFSTKSSLAYKPLCIQATTTCVSTPVA